MNSHLLLLAMSQQAFKRVATQLADSQRSCALTECHSCQSFSAELEMIESSLLFPPKDLMDGAYAARLIKKA